MQVGIRELKARLRTCLERAQAGEEIVVTDRGRPVARIVGSQAPALPARLQEMERRGELRRARLSGGDLPRLRPLKTEFSLSDFLIRERRRDHLL